MLTLSPEATAPLWSQYLFSTLLCSPGDCCKCVPSLTGFPTLCSTQNSPQSPCCSDCFLLALTNIRGPFLFQLNRVAPLATFIPPDSAPFPCFSLFTAIQRTELICWCSLQSSFHTYVQVALLWACLAFFFSPLLAVSQCLY